MLRRFSFILGRFSFGRFSFGRLGICTAILLCWNLPPSCAQMGSVGTVNVIGLDPSGAAGQGAKLVLQDLATNEIRRLEAQAEGTSTFATVPLVTYKLTVTTTGFQPEDSSSALLQ